MEGKQPHSGLQLASKRILPPGVYRFMFGPVSDFPVWRRITGAAFGAVTGVALFFGLMYNITMPPVHQITVGCVFATLCIFGGMFSLLFRCSLLLIFPSMLGSQGRTFLMVLVLNGLYQGPIVNIQRNVQNVAFSMGCNIDLQIANSKLLWKSLTEPYVQVVQEIVRDSGEFHTEAESVRTEFKKVRDELMSQYGYESFGKDSSTANDTQEEFVQKTKELCNTVVIKGIDACHQWFHEKWIECMEEIKVDLVNFLLCTPMKFNFICNILKVTTPWCEEKIPVEGNFGQTFDKLNDTINSLAEQFRTRVLLKNLSQSELGVHMLHNITEDLTRKFAESKDTADRISEVMRYLLSFTFITVFISAFGYIHQFCRDICFDNVYITTYFTQIDSRRKSAGKRYLLPLKKAEQKSLVNPWSFSVHSSELMAVLVGFLQFLSLVLFVCVLFAVDGIMYSMFDLIRRHSFTNYSITSAQDTDIDIGGSSMLARLLRKTIGALNVSINIDLQYSNLDCLPKPHTMSTSNYLWIFIPLFFMFLICFLQVHANRLRRVISTFYFPKREKKRVIFLYNLQIQRRIYFINRQRKMLRINQSTTFTTVQSVLFAALKRVGCGLRWCWVCDAFVRLDQAVECSTETCPVIYCQQCWTDMDRVCYACLPQELHNPHDSDSDVYYSRW